MVVFQLLVSCPQTPETYSVTNLIRCLENDAKILALTAETHLGPTRKMPLTASAMDFFQLFVPDNVLKNMVVQTNMYAKKYQERFGSDDAWIDVTLTEMKAFLGYMISTSIHHCESVLSIWSSGFYSNKSIALIMTQSRFEKILKYFHIVAFRSSQTTHSLYKIQPFLDSLQNGFDSAFRPSQAQVLHEPLIDEDPVFIATCTERELRKRKKRKFSLWVRQCSSTGFICQSSCQNIVSRKFQSGGSEIYVHLKEGSGADGLDALKNKPQLHSMVAKSLCQNASGKNYIIFTGPSITSLNLFEEFEKQDLYKEHIYPSLTYPDEMARVIIKRKSGEIPCPLAVEAFAAHLSYICKYDDKYSNSALWSTYQQCTLSLYSHILPPTVDSSSSNHSLLTINLRRSISKLPKTVMYFISHKPNKTWQQVFWFAISIAINNAYILYKMSEAYHVTRTNPVRLHRGLWLSAAAIPHGITAVLQSLAGEHMIRLQSVFANNRSKDVPHALGCVPPFPVAAKSPLGPGCPASPVAQYHKTEVKRFWLFNTAKSQKSFQHAQEVIKPQCVSAAQSGGWLIPEKCVGASTGQWINMTMPWLRAGLPKTGPSMRRFCLGICSPSFIQEARAAAREVLRFTGIGNPQTWMRISSPEQRDSPPTAQPLSCTGLEAAGTNCSAKTPSSITTKFQYRVVVQQASGKSQIMNSLKAWEGLFPDCYPKEQPAGVMTRLPLSKGADAKHNRAARELPCHSPNPRELEMLSCSSVAFPVLYNGQKHDPKGGEAGSAFLSLSAATNRLAQLSRWSYHQESTPVHFKTNLLERERGGTEVDESILQKLSVNFHCCDKEGLQISTLLRAATQGLVEDTPPNAYLLHSEKTDSQDNAMTHTTTQIKCGTQVGLKNKRGSIIEMNLGTSRTLVTLVT
ncbi:hypothetical protein IHE44_0009211 [Lamprotornis superbus]|uniref:PiggyBac transposable element-derived protein domain-containing protein n=1 Tax=Lamprotornis superbus TaxID=245042 RepID=A0A835TYL2_9PASS|nr:hypothetical protein IHE44_0009211 [Lamprotornis superbus]